MSIGIVGPLVGIHGRVTTQGEKLRDAMRGAGMSVIATSTSNSRLGRLSDIAATIVRDRARLEVMIVFTYGFKSFVVEDMATALGRAFGIPVVISLCGGELPKFMAAFPNWTRRVLRRAQTIVCQSPYLAREVAAYGFETTVIPNVFDVERYPFRHRARVRPKLFWMRTFEDLYNPLLALRTLQHVRVRFPDATLVMAGEDAGLQKLVEQRARAWGLGDAVRFPGFLSLEGKRREGAASDIFLNTPRIDNRPICVVEAAALGLPIVATRVGGIPDLLQHEETGLLVPHDNDRAMADAVIRLVEEPALAAHLSTTGRALAQHSAIEHVLPQWQALLAAVQSTRT